MRMVRKYSDCVDGDVDGGVPRRAATLNSNDR